MRDSNWLCLDCSKDTFDEYYGVRNHLWRRAVDRSQRHGMLCLSCLERRLSRFLRLEDFKPPVSERRAAFTGDIYVPIRVPVFRFAAIVEIFYPELSERAKDLDSRVTAYRNILIEIAANKMQRTQMTEPLMGRLAKNAESCLLQLGRPLRMPGMRCGRNWMSNAFRPSERWTSPVYELRVQRMRPQILHIVLRPRH